jgi:4-hydroxy-4-methyl-2-oxoglutarate aldolase
MILRDEIRDFPDWTTPLLADGCLRAGVSLRVAPAGIRSVIAGQRIRGPVRPVRHYGSVDVFLEAIAASRTGEVLVIDNGGRLDEACIGDLSVLEAHAADLAGMIVWGAHRDTAELLKIGFPVFSYGALPAGPTRLDPRDSRAFGPVSFGSFEVGEGDSAFADEDGVLFVEATETARVLSMARSVFETERSQAEHVRSGRTLAMQLDLEGYVAERAKNPRLTFREHLRRLKAAIEV